MKFLGEYDNLKSLIAKQYDGDWRDIENGYQFRTAKNVIINWYAATGVLTVQGSEQLKNSTIVNNLLNGPPNATPTEKILKKDEPFVKSNDETIVPIKDDDKTFDSQPIKNNNETFESQFIDTELVIALVGAVGTDLARFTHLLSERLILHKYVIESIKISSDILPNFTDKPIPHISEYHRINELMSLGNEARKLSGENGILAMAVAAEINKRRGSVAVKRNAFIVSSIKHPDEVQKLRQIYGNGFFLFGVYSDEQQRFRYLTIEKGIPTEDANKLIERDRDESIKHGQHTSDAFHLSDFFINCNGDENRLKSDLWRCVNLIFGHPYTTPLFDETAMFMAFANSSRSSDLSRQVGAIISLNEQIIGTGCNDTPKAGGGLYAPNYNNEGTEIVDVENGRDYKRGFDSNVHERLKIIEELAKMIPELNPQDLKKRLNSSRLKDLTEFGRVVHAEMDAITSCARMGIGVQGATLYCTTFPCHNCAKHIIASGFKRVVYVEPYPKSKAFEFHSESIILGLGNDTGGKVTFEPFVGVGPRNFINLFSMKMGMGSNLERKRSADGQILDWAPESSNTRLNLIRASYIDLEGQCGRVVLNVINSIKGDSK